jgi:SpoVK/Ycf46/Vps4 family AAA+-type ATPase
MSDEEIDPLREALRASPDNVPLRRHLARTLAKLGRWAEAEVELRAALKRVPADEAVQTELARAFAAQGKHAEASTLLEARAESGTASPPTLVLFARVLHSLGETARSVRVYRAAIEADPSAADEALAKALGAGPVRAAETESSGAADADDDAAADDSVEIERPKIKFADVGGMAGVKDEIRMKIVHPLQHPELYRAYGKTIGGGVLMYGPPGCGKTHLARATAGEVSAAFAAVGLSDVLNMWFGESERRLHETFERARRHKPCVLFFDEVDALGAARGDSRADGGRRLVNQFLEEMDGVKTSNDGVLVLAATNAPWALDSAFRRPGRFDRILFVAPPDEPARAEILRALLRDKPQRDLDLAAIAARTNEFSGADLKGVVDQTIEAKLREAMKTGVPGPIVTADLERAVKKARPSTREWFATARNYALHANQGGAYDDVLKYLKLG